MVNQADDSTVAKYAITSLEENCWLSPLYFLKMIFRNITKTKISIIYFGFFSLSKYYYSRIVI